MSVFELSGRTALVTGGAQGLGEGMAKALANAGAQVMVADIQDGSAVAKARSAKGQSCFPGCDTTAHVIPSAAPVLQSEFAAVV